MLHRHRVLGLAASLTTALLIGSCSEATETIDPPVTPDPYSQLSTVVQQERTELRVPGVVLAMIENGDKVYTAEIGGVRYRDERELSAATRFPIGALTRPLTAIGLLRLVDAGLVDLDAPVSRYVGELAAELSSTRYPIADKSVTIRQLLTHSSGLPDERVNVSFYDPSDSELDAYLTSELFAEKYHLMFPPGRMYFESNLGFDLAGLVIERVTGRAFPDYMGDEVFAKLGMTTATFRTAEVAADGDYAYGTMDDMKPIYPLLNAQPWQRPSMLAYASVEDLSALAFFLMNGDPEVLSRELYQEMTTAQLDTQLYLDRVQQGLGILVYDGYPTQRGLLDYDLTTLACGGTLFGHTVQLFVVPEHQFALVIAASHNDAWFERTAAFTRTTFLRLPENPGEGPVVESSEQPSAFAGNYLTDTGTTTGLGEVAVSLEGDDLWLSCPTNGWTYELTTVADGSYQVPCRSGFPHANLTFLLDAHGNVEYLRALPLGFVASPKLDFSTR